MGEIKSSSTDNIVATDFIKKDHTPSILFDENNKPKLYKRRWLMLLMFSALSFSNAFQWIHMNIISDRIKFFWNASIPASSAAREMSISFLSTVFMLVYVVLIIPGMWFLEHNSLRLTTILAALLNALGAWIKCFAITPDGSKFYLLLIAQTVCGISQVYILGIPSYLAGIWFGINELSTATALAIFGNQLGIGFGLAIPSYCISSPNENSTHEEYIVSFQALFYSGGAVTTTIFLIICIGFYSKPPTPPSLGQIYILSKDKNVEYLKQLKLLIKDVHFLLLFFSFGINTGCFYALSTVLNGLLLTFSKNNTLIGTAGFVFIIAGIVAALFIGFILDKTKKFRLILITVYLLSSLSMVLFTACFYFNSWAVMIISIILLGLFMTGYLPIGFDVAAEITFPVSENITAGLLNLSAQIIGVGYTSVLTVLLDKYGALYSNVSVVVILVFGFFLTALINVQHRRQEANLVGQIIEITQPEENLIQ